ncbi:MAG: POTRA domain-containing protein, partial [Rhodoblastus sp.]|uniref:POTRA domain-containing protein n=1 Tax=Rhodoblastus sp. TaxID=1962975 RepID=UPI003F9C888A
MALEAMRHSNGDRVSMKFRQGLMGRSALAVVLIASSLAVPTAAYAETIIVEGNRHVDSDTIRSYFAGGDTNEGVKKLYGSGYFSDVQVSHRGNALVVHVVENANTINHVVFVGNSKIKTEDIEKEIRSKAHGGYNQAIVDADAQRIMDMYRRAGRSTATVKARTVETPKGTVDVVFDINEGEKTGIKQINFV